ncbi:MAG: tetratricopeptide repeat protein, partial [Flavobacteriales bacterium]
MERQTKSNSPDYFVRACLTAGFVCFQIVACFAQNQGIADSLNIIYHEGKLQSAAKLELLEKLSFNERQDLNLSLKYAEELISLSKLENNSEYLSRGFIQKGNANRILGNWDNALDAFFKSAEAAIKANDIKNQGVANMSIADIYSEIGNSDNAEIYYNKAIELLRKTDDTVSLATALLNAGDEAFNSKSFDLALQHFEESGLLFESTNYLIGTAYNKGNIGMVYAEQGRDSLAKFNINEALVILEKLEDYSPIAEYLTYMADIYLKQDDWSTALSYNQKSLEIAKKYGLKKQIGDSNLKLAELYEKFGDQATSYKYYKDHIVYRDLVNNIETVQKMADQRTNYEVSQKQIKIDLLDQKQKNQRIVVIAIAIALFSIGILAVGLYRRNKFIRKTKQIIEEERDRSDSLLRNILPEETAEELKLNGKVQAKQFEAVTVLFTDFKGFTQYSENLSPTALVDTIGFYFSRFDEIIEKHGLEKIKTIGDAYMCAGGLPFPTKDHAKKMVKAAFEIIEFVKATKRDVTASELTFEIRIGINTGPVVAGVVGTKKFAYDIWGDTVNVASRMESNSEAGKI